jgi:hypothetical protein
MANRMRATGREIILQTGLDSTARPRIACAIGRAGSQTLPRLAIVTTIIIETTMVVTGGIIIAR